MRLTGLAGDIRIALRGLRQAPGFALATVITLALGVSVNTSVGAVAYGILYRALPYPEPERVVVITSVYQGTEYALPLEDVEQWRSRLRTVESVAGYTSVDLTLRGDGRPRLIRTALVTDDFFRVLGVPAVQGRLDAGWCEKDYAAVSQRLDRFGERRALGIGPREYEVAAILPATFAFPSDDVRMWIPANSTAKAAPWSTRDQAVYFRLVARMKRGVTVAQLRQDAARVAKEVSAAGGATGDPEVMLIGERLLGHVQPLLVAFMVSSALVLLVACANVASLLVGRAMLRHGDLAIRLALGASPAHLVRAALVESGLVAVAGCVAGVVLSTSLVRLFITVAGGLLPRLETVRVDAAVLAGSALVCVAVTLLCGAAPALFAVRSNLAAALGRSSSRATQSGRRSRRLLVAAQVALSVVLLTTAGLLARTVVVLLQQDAGFKSDRALTVTLPLSDVPGSDGAEGRRQVAEVLRRVSAIPGVARASVASNLPPRVSPFKIGITFASSGRGFHTFSFASVTPGYFQALGIRLLQGREFEEGDGDKGEPTAVFSEEAARIANVRVGDVGFRLPRGLGIKAPRVVGIVADVKYAGLDAPLGPAIYVPWALLPSGVSRLIVRTTIDDPLLIANQVRSAISAVEPRLAVTEIRTMSDEVASSIADRRARLVPALAFAGIGLVIALVGLFALTVRSVAERRRELAIRAAFGAAPGQAIGLLMRDGVGTVLLGAGAGFVGSAIAASVLKPLLYGVTPFDPKTWIAVGVLMVSVASVTTFVSARRAAAIDPVELLRSE
jgi:putative ABC transport system permease protein